MILIHFQKLLNQIFTDLQNRLVICIYNDICSRLVFFSSCFHQLLDIFYILVSIECCHPDETGKFNEATYKSMVQLTAWLCEKFSLTEEDVIRHYDITGKICPKYFVENEDAWKQFKSDVKAVLDNAK